MLYVDPGLFIVAIQPPHWFGRPGPEATSCASLWPINVSAFNDMFDLILGKKWKQRAFCHRSYFCASTQWNRIQSNLLLNVYGHYHGHNSLQNPSLLFMFSAFTVGKKQIFHLNEYCMSFGDSKFVRWGEVLVVLEELWSCIAARNFFSQLFRCFKHHHEHTQGIGVDILLWDPGFLFQLQYLKTLMYYLLRNPESKLQSGIL